MDGEDLAFAGLVAQARALRERQLSSRELVDATLERIEALDTRLNAFCQVYAEQARATAQAADERLAAGDELPLLGVPVAIKDDADVEGDMTTFGTAAEDRPARADSEVVRRLREAGAVLVGRTNAPELLLWPFTESKTYGITRNPWSPGHTPGGSSGGSAAAVAAGMVPAALGSDGAGSIRIPAACCGLFGLKTQRDRISPAPHSAADHTWHGLAVYGPLARRVEDAALFLDATAQTGAGSFLPASQRAPGTLRIAVSLKPPLAQPVGDEAKAAVEQMASTLSSLGHRVSRRDPDYVRAIPHMMVRYASGSRLSARALAHPERLERKTATILRLGRLVPDSAVVRSRAQETALAARLGRVFEDADVLLSPVTARPAIEVGHWAERGGLWTLNGASRLTMNPMLSSWNVTGQPAAAVPAGVSRDGLPLGVQLVGRAGDEATLLSLSAQLQAELDWPARRPPA